MSKPKLIVVLGPTACGKSGLGVDLAKRVGGEIVSADSRQVYRGLDLGTGKITLEEMAGVPHHMLDIIDPGTPYSAAEFQRGAYAAIDGILARGKVPLLVGGTGLYVRAVAEGYVFQDAPPNPALRDRLETWDVPALYARFQTLTGLTLSESERNNRQRLVRAVEKAESGAYADAARAPRYDVLQLGCAYPREILHRRIDLRLRARLDAGMAGEVSGLLDAGVSGDFLEGLGLEYRWLYRYLTGRLPDEAALVDELGRAIKRFAKRQVQWFKKDPVLWLDMDHPPLAQAAGAAERFLAGA